MIATNHVNKLKKDKRVLKVTEDNAQNFKGEIPELIIKHTRLAFKPDVQIYQKICNGHITGQRMGEIYMESLWTLASYFFCLFRQIKFV